MKIKALAVFKHPVICVTDLSALSPTDFQTPESTQQLQQYLLVIDPYQKFTAPKNAQQNTKRIGSIPILWAGRISCPAERSAFSPRGNKEDMPRRLLCAGDVIRSQKRRGSWQLLKQQDKREALTACIRWWKSTNCPVWINQCWSVCVVEGGWAAWEPRTGGLLHEERGFWEFSA